MTNEELKAKIASIKCFEDAYKLACEGGYKGTAEEFATLVENAADEIMPMDLDAMDSVAGGSFTDNILDTWDSVSSGVSNIYNKAADWVSNNPALTAEIAGGVALVGVAIGTSVVAYKNYKHNQARKATFIHAEPDLNTQEVMSNWTKVSIGGGLTLGSDD